MHEYEKIITSLQLEPHPEGGWFKRVFPADGDDSFGISTIYYLLEGEDFSSFHRLHGLTEIWYHQAGCALDIHVIKADGTLVTHHLEPGGQMQAAIEPESWFAAEIPGKEGFVLVGCAVAPAFGYESFELATKESLLKEFPQHSSLITRLCRQ